MKTLSFKRGFTLIELLVVIAIIAMLASVILASLNSARSKSRDARREADVKELQTAVEEYISANQAPPATLNALTGVYIQTVPQDPTQLNYGYATLGNHYCIGIRLENAVPNSAGTCAAASGVTGMTEPITGGVNLYFVGS